MGSFAQVISVFKRGALFILVRRNYVGFPALEDAMAALSAQTAPARTSFSASVKGAGDRRSCPSDEDTECFAGMLSQHCAEFVEADGLQADGLQVTHSLSCTRLKGNRGASYCGSTSRSAPWQEASFMGSWQGLGRQDCHS